ncbi:MAG TPA: hypothetical protein EYH42_02800 [Sulfurovum sp.]|nr:hypothetical protein [Sulfurovum sp.]
MQKSIEKKQSLWESLHSLLVFTFSDKLKFSIKVSLSMALAYLIPLSQGWSQPQTAPITIMLIAAMGSLSASIHVGAQRVLGTVIGAIIGMSLIAIFPQERMYYLISLSLIVTFILYLVRAYKGDNTTFMLTAMTMMMVFQNGKVDDVFLYGIDKTYMTVFGIGIYTLVGVFLWPVNVEDKSKVCASKLTTSQLAVFEHRDMVQEERNQYIERLLSAEKALENASGEVNAIDVTPSQWYSLLHHYKRITAYLTLLTLDDKERYSDTLSKYVSNIEKMETEIITLFKEIEEIWQTHDNIELPESITPEYEKEAIVTLTHLERASLITTIEDMKKLHEELRQLARKLNSVHSALPTSFDTNNIPKEKHFLWADVEHLKGALVSFLIFWVATYFWIEMNPPGGFMIVALATGLSVLTTFTPIKPSMLIVVFSFSFIFAIFMYVAVLPQLRYGWELGIFIFVYSFVSFHLVNPQMSIFFLLGLFTFAISNTMYYDFSIFLLILLMFYCFLILLHIFYYIPFSTKPEYLFLELKNRLFRLSYHLLDIGRKAQEGKHNLWGTVLANYSNVHLINTVKNMQLWASKVDEKYFNMNKEVLTAFGMSCEKFVYLVELLYHRDLEMQNNTLIAKLREEYTLPYFSDLLKQYALGKNVQDVDAFWKDEVYIINTVEKSLAQTLEKIDFSHYSRTEIGEMYENISLRKNVWLALFACQNIMKKIDFKALEESRF